jgi:hypothetical protein
MSPIEKRMMIEEMQRSQKKAGPMMVRNTNLENVMTELDRREAEVCQKLREFKEKRKSVTFNNVLEEAPINELLQSKELKFGLSAAASNRVESKEFCSPERSVTKSILKNSNKYGEQSSERREKDQGRKGRDSVVEGSSPVVANFTFQLPSAEHSHTFVKPASSIIRPHPGNHEDSSRFIIDRSHSYEKSHSAKMLDKSLGSIRYEPKSHTNRHESDKDDERLSRLSSKI